MKLLDAIAPSPQDLFVEIGPGEGALTGPLLEKIAKLEVVERMVAAPSTPAYGRLSVSLQARFRMKKLFNVTRGAFRPPPKVESALVRLEPLDWQLPVDEELLRRAFSARRKTLRNALPEVDFAALGIDPRLRPENLSPEDYARLSIRSVGQRETLKKR